MGFRYTVKALTPGFEVTGVIRNLPDGRVELLAEGERGELEEFLESIRTAGVGPLIRDESVQWTEASGQFRGFAIGG